MKHAPDMQNPMTDQFACDLYHATPKAVLEIEVPRPGGNGWGPWETIPAEAREFYRARARRFMAGDLSVMPWKSPVSWEVSRGFGMPR